jgi:hypothetical protein
LDLKQMRRFAGEAVRAVVLRTFYIAGIDGNQEEAAGLLEINSGFADGQPRRGGEARNRRSG